MTLLEFLRHLPLFGFGIRSTSSQILPEHIRPDEALRQPKFWYLHGR